MSDVQVGVLADQSLKGWQVRALERMLAESNSRITRVAINRRETSIRDSFKEIRRAKAYACMAGRRKFATKLGFGSPLFASTPTTDVECLSGAKFLDCRPNAADGLGVTLPADVVERFEDCAAVVRFGFGILKGEILSTPTHGTLSYHHGDIREYRGRPAGFWEFMEGADQVGITLQKLSPELDKGKIAAFREVPVGPREPYQSIRDRMFEASVGMLSMAIDDIDNDRFAPREPDRFGQLYKPPSWITYLRYLRKNIPRSLQFSRK